MDKFDGCHLDAESYEFTHKSSHADMADILPESAQVFTTHLHIHGIGNTPLFKHEAEAICKATNKAVCIRRANELYGNNYIVDVLDKVHFEVSAKNSPLPFVDISMFDYINMEPVEGEDEFAYLAFNIEHPVDTFRYDYIEYKLEKILELLGYTTFKEYCDDGNFYKNGRWYEDDGCIIVNRVCIKEDITILKLLAQINQLNSKKIDLEEIFSDSI